MNSPTDAPEEDRIPRPPSPGDGPGNPDSESKVARILEDAPTDAPGSRHPVVWGRYQGTNDHPAGAFLLVCRPSSASSKSEPEDERPVQRLRVAFPGDERLPSLEDAESFEQSLINFSLGEEPTPEATRESHRDAIVRFLSEGNHDTLLEILQEGRQEEFETWVRGLLESFLNTQPSQYAVCARFQSPSITAEVSPDDVNEEEASPDSDPDPLELQAVTKPSEGRPVRELEEGDEILVRIVGSGVNQLPETVIDRDRSQPASLPMACRVRSRQPVSDLPKGYEDADPSDYDQLKVELKPGVIGETLLFRDDRLKRVEDHREPDSDETFLPDRELAVLGMLVALLFVVILVLASL